MVPLKHWIMELIKQVLPRFFKPVVPIVTTPSCENELLATGAYLSWATDGRDVVSSEGFNGTGGGATAPAEDGRCGGAVSGESRGAGGGGGRGRVGFAGTGGTSYRSVFVSVNP